MIETEIKKINYWNDYAKWYRLWRTHTTYHEPIKKLLLHLISEKCRILDIGAGDGVLSFPLLEKKCSVTALEPSTKIREFLIEKNRDNLNKVDIDSRRFEDLAIHELNEYDLVLACNSLHLTEDGLEGSLFKIFNSGVKNFFLVSEKPFPINKLTSYYPSYKMLFYNSYVWENSFAYHSIDELLEHWEFKFKRELYPFEKDKIFKNLSYEFGHIWIKDYANVSIAYWRKKG